MFFFLMEEYSNPNCLSPPTPSVFHLRLLKGDFPLILLELALQIPFFSPIRNAGTWDEKFY